MEEIEVISKYGFIKMQYNISINLLKFIIN